MLSKQEFLDYINNQCQYKSNEWQTFFKLIEFCAGKFYDRVFNYSDFLNLDNNTTDAKLGFEMVFGGLEREKILRAKKIENSRGRAVALVNALIPADWNNDCGVREYGISFFRRLDGQELLDGSGYFAIMQYPNQSLFETNLDYLGNLNFTEMELYYDSYADLSYSKLSKLNTYLECPFRALKEVKNEKTRKNKQN